MKKNPQNSHNFLPGFFVQLKKQNIFAIAISVPAKGGVKFLKKFGPVVQFG